MTHKQPIKVFTSFSGYDSQCMALDRLGVDYDLVGWSEIDKYAIQAHDLLFPQFAGRNFGDIREIDWAKVPDFDLFTMSSPCQDFSNAGLQQGGEEGSGTRSSLLWECRRAIVEKRPKYVVFENVKGLVSQKFLPYFLKWQEELSGLGYTNFAQVLNAKDCGVAQNRERVFMVSILGGGWYNFPQKQRLTRCLADYLEDDVAEKYYLSEKMLAGFKVHDERHNDRGNGFAFEPNDIEKPVRTIQTTNGSRNTDNYIKVAGNLCINHEANSRVYHPSGICPTIETAQGGGRQPKILQRGRGFNKGGSFDLCPTISKSAWEQNNAVMQINPSTESGGVQPYQQNRVYHTGGLIPALGTTNPGNVAVSCAMRGRPTMDGNNAQQIELNSTEFANSITTVQKDSMVSINRRIRRLTPRECFRLMDVLDSDFDKLNGISDTQLYKMAGNSIVTACLVGIFKNLLNQCQSTTTPPVRAHFAPANTPAITF